MTPGDLVHKADIHLNTEAWWRDKKNWRNSETLKTEKVNLKNKKWKLIKKTWREKNRQEVKKIEVGIFENNHNEVAVRAKKKLESKEKKSELKRKRKSSDV